MKSLPRELEIKLELTTEQTRRLIARMSAASPTATRCALRSIYFDTADWSLRAKGLSLRVRRIGGAWIQTLKAEKFIAGGVSNPIELEAEVEAERPSVDAIADEKLRRLIKKLTAASPLVPLFETNFDRTSMRVTTVGADEIEVSLDIGAARASSRQEKLHEAEIELKRGNPTALIEVVREIAGDGPVRPGLLSKADRGYRLLGEKPTVPMAAVKAEPPAIERGMTSGAAIGEVYRVVTASILHNWRVLEDYDDAEAAHQLRVGVRRLRAALRILRGLEDDERMRALDTTARDLSRVVGRLRDIDVLMSDIVEPLVATDHISRGVTILRSRLARERRSRRAAVLAAFEVARFGVLRIELGLLPHYMDRMIDANPKQLGRPVEDVAAKALRKLLRRVTKRATDLASLSIEARHELRKAIKPFRYGVEFFGPLYPRAKTRRLLACASELQTTLGYLNDMALAETLLALDWPGNAREAAAARAIGAVIGWHTAKSEQAWSDVKSTWKRFERATHFLA